MGSFSKLTFLLIQFDLTARIFLITLILRHLAAAEFEGNVYSARQVVMALSDWRRVSKITALLRQITEFKDPQRQSTEFRGFHEPNFNV
jgi:hypothetical protein